MRNIFKAALVAASLLVTGNTVFAAPFHGWNGTKPLLPPAKVEVSPDGARDWNPEIFLPPKPGDPAFGHPTIFAIIDDCRPGRPGRGGWHTSFEVAGCPDLFKKGSCTDLFKKK